VARVRIYRPAKTAMQSGRAKTDEWLMEFEPGDAKVRDALMGWAGSRDTRNQLHLSFATRDEAVAFAEKHGLDHVVLAPRERKIVPKSYADNFRADRIGNWTH
jgi:hypothetical protein